VPKQKGTPEFTSAFPKYKKGGYIQGRIQTVAQVAHATVNIQLRNNIFSHLEHFSNLYYIK